jgi:hypothetical protein
MEAAMDESMTRARILKLIREARSDWKAALAGVPRGRMTMLSMNGGGEAGLRSPPTGRVCLSDLL